MVDAFPEILWFPDTYLCRSCHLVKEHVFFSFCVVFLFLVRVIYFMMCEIKKFWKFFTTSECNCN